MSKKRIEIIIYADYDDADIDFEEVEQHLLYDFNTICNCDIKRVDLIDVKEN